MAAVAAAVPAQRTTVEIAVYGGTSGGVAAAVQAARMGKQVILIEPGRNLGGMTSGGLGLIDVRGRQWIGGLAREFLSELTARYAAQGINLAALGNEGCLAEPHIAEGIFKDWIANHRVRVVFEHRLAAVTMDGRRIRSVLLDHAPPDQRGAPAAVALRQGALEVAADVFIDASYEGDLMAGAGVPHRTDREGTAETGESLAGVRHPYAAAPTDLYNLDIDPYVVPGNPASGLLPLINSGSLPPVGEPSTAMQAYNFRLCLTKSDPLPIAPPADYDPARFELFGRYFTACEAAGDPQTVNDLFMTARHARLVKISPLPNTKSDVNNGGPISTDFVDFPTENYATASWAARAEIWHAHEDYIRGLMYFLRTDPRVSQAVRNEVAAWGLARDEFVATGHWPHQLYIREGRRMVGRHVMRQSDCQQALPKEDPVGLGSYALDSHTCQRFLGDNGRIASEGNFYTPLTGPYQIPYRSITPAQADCENLLVTFCVSASHVAFGSMRMEPVFMALSHSAAAAAAIAIEDGLPVQQIDYRKLALQLLADGQVLARTASPIDPPNGVIADSEDPTSVIAGDWSSSTSIAGYSGANYLHDGNVGKGAKSVILRPRLAAAGRYDVYLRWAAFSNRASNVPVTILHAGGSSGLTVDQRTNGSQWVKLGAWSFPADGSAGLKIENAGTNGHVVADAARWVPEGEPLDPVRVYALASDPVTTEGQATDPARILLVRTGESSAPLQVELACSGAATPGIDVGDVPATVSFAVGETSLALPIAATADDLLEGDEQLTVAIQPGAGYQPGADSAATVTVRDHPFDSWRSSRFTPAQLADPGVSGKLADPDHDGLETLLEYACGTDPWIPNAAPLSLRMEAIDGGIYQVFRVARNPAAADALLTVEVTGGLTPPSWNSANTVVMLDTPDSLVVRDAVGLLPPQPESAAGVVADNADPATEIAGGWTGSTVTGGCHGRNYLHDRNDGKGGKSVTLRPALGEPGEYDVYLRWTSGTNRASNVPVTVLHEGGASSLSINQRQSGARWVWLGTWRFRADGSAGVRIETTGTDGYVIADAVLWLPRPSSGPRLVRLRVEVP